MSKKEDTAAPRILKLWIDLYRSSPKLYIPGTEIDFGFSLVCAIPLTLLRLFFRHVFYYVGWDHSADTLSASGCMPSICHSSLLVPGLLATLLSHKYVPSATLRGTPQWYQDSVHALLSFCTGYMIYDMFMSYFAEKWQPGQGPVLTSEDWMYVGHHVLTSLYMVSTRWAECGHISAMVLMFFGEASNPNMNIKLIVERAMKQDSFKGVSWLPTLYIYNDQVFSTIYILCRVFAASFVFPHLTYDLLVRGKKNAPMWLIVVWLILCYGVQIGSIPLIFECIATLKNGPFMSNAGVAGEL